ncbi:hypothetical protein SAMN05428944_2455 [Streptomyces sp. 1222.5]|uniref:hypothetical protein n=1 Tax=unclassified Streptomyces TaxID=2593676 RepID=UPI000897F429|nr:MULTISPECIES: hypothetical protein [unclassified Streptomyces]PKW10359.1 hypothetical protein BX260_5637 [Streptomyces sp. 5112.2]SEC08147.1 hypothetical protein SAMN05428944_2455 [Streptomyces sp. 1222.5]SED83864.1 hypothetical protein SAMN05216532_5915 [Streptomyces sp. 2231.1]
MIVVLLGVLALVIGGCVCVVWAERGGPRWARVVAKVTLVAAEVVSTSTKNRSRGRNNSSGDD